MSAPFQTSPQPCVHVLIHRSLSCCDQNTRFVMTPLSSQQLLFSLDLQLQKSTDAFAIIYTSLLSGVASQAAVTTPP